MNSFFKAVLETGARQVGKTTMLKHLAKDQNRTYVSMDDMMVRTLAKSDPVLFFQTYRPPIIIDEIQKAPELFEQIKIMCDESEERGLFWLTGSQQYGMMKNIRETLAGRIGILELYNRITDSVRFRKFLTACAALTAEQVNYKTLADASEISQPTAKEWLRLLQDLGVIYLLAPYANNELKRLTKTPKLYFCDTGLCAYLSMWLTRDTLMNGVASGHYFENYVIMELLKNFAYAPSKAQLTYYRDSNAKEIDVFVEENGVIHPLEIKKSANPDKREIKKYELLDRINLKHGDGGIICMCEQVVPIDEKNCFIPCNLI